MTDPTALAEQTSASSLAMKKRSADMSARLSFFTIGDGEFNMPDVEVQSFGAEEKLAKSARFGDEESLSEQDQHHTDGGAARKLKTVDAAPSFEDEQWEEF